jgi:hypothetical protein
LQEEQSVNITGSTDAGADGTFIITLGGVSNPATDFVLLGSVSLADGTGGTIATTVLTIAEHPYQTGMRLVIRGADWSGGSLDGSYDLLGRIDTNTVSIPFFTTGSYTSGGITGDDGLVVPSQDGRGIWHRICDDSKVHAIWYGMPLDGVNDDAPAIRAAIAAVSAGQTVFHASSTVILPRSPEDINAPYFPKAPVHVSRACRIKGAGRGATTVYTAALVSGFFFDPPSISPDAGAAAFACIEDLTLISQLTDIPGHQTNHPYAAGARIYAPSTDPGEPAIPGGPHFDLHVYYVAVNGGKSGATAPRFNDAPDLLTADGDITWLCQAHSGLVIRSTSEPSRVDAEYFNGAGHLLVADNFASPPVGPSDANISNYYALGAGTCGVGYAIVGGDTNAMNFWGGFIADCGLPAAGFPGNGGLGIYDRSYGGSQFWGVCLECTGVRGIRSTSPGGSQYFACHTECAYANHFGIGSMSFGGTHAAGFTTNSLGLLWVQGASLSQGWQYTANTQQEGVTAHLQTAPRDANSVEVWSTDDEGAIFFSREYGHALTGDFWWSYLYAEGVWQNYAISDHRATYDGTHLLGSVFWLPAGWLRGLDRWYQFDDANARDNLFIRSGYRLQGDRIIIAPSLTAFGVASEQVVITPGYEGPPWPANAVMLAPGAFGSPSTGFNYTIRPTSDAPAAQQSKRFQVQSVTEDARTGAEEPDWSTATIAGASTVTDNHVVWLYIGNAPVYGVDILDDPDNARQGATTTDNTPNVPVATYHVNDQETKVITSQILGTQTSGAGDPDSYFEIRRIVVRRNGSAITVLKPDTQIDIQINVNDPAWSTSLAVVGTTVQHQVTGATGQTINWGTTGGAFGVSS